MDYESHNPEFNDLQAAMAQLKDEVEGISAYKRIYEHAKCPALKALAEKALQTERQHATNLSAWIHNYVTTTEM